MIKVLTKTIHTLARGGNKTREAITYNMQLNTNNIFSIQINIIVK